MASHTDSELQESIAELKHTIDEWPDDVLEWLCNKKACSLRAQATNEITEHNVLQFMAFIRPFQLGKEASPDLPQSPPLWCLGLKEGAKLEAWVQLLVKDGLIKFIDAGAAKEHELETFLEIVKVELLMYLDKDEVDDAYVNAMGQVLEVSQAIQAVQAKEVLRHMSLADQVEKIKKAFNFVDHQKPLALLANALGSCTFWKDKICAWLEKVSSLRRHQAELGRVTSFLDKAHPEKVEDRDTKELLSLTRDMVVLQEDCIDDSIATMSDNICKRIKHHWALAKAKIEAQDDFDMGLLQEMLSEASAAFPSYMDINTFRSELNKIMLEQQGTCKLNEMLLALQQCIGEWKQNHDLSHDSYQALLDRMEKAKGLQLGAVGEDTLKHNVEQIRDLCPHVIKKGEDAIPKLHSVMVKVTVWDKKKLLEDLTMKLKVLLDMQVALAYYSGKEITLAVQEDSTREKMAALMRATQEGESMLGSHWCGADALKAEVENAKKVLTKAKDEMLLLVTKTLENASTSLTSVYDGTGEQHWLSGVEETSWAEVHKASDEQLSALSVKTYAPEVDKLQEACLHPTHVCLKQTQEVSRFKKQDTNKVSGRGGDLDS